MKKIRVLHTEWSDGWGGQEIRIITEMESLRERGVELFLATRENAKIKDEAIKRGFRVFTSPFKNIFDLKTIFGLVKIIKENKIDIVNTHSGKDTWIGGIAAKLSGVKFIRTRHLSNPINPSRLNFINEFADFIITTGENVRKNMIKNNRIKPEKIISIPTGADEKIFDPAKYDFIECKREFGMDDKKINIGIIAVIRHVKRHDIFVNVAKKLSEKYDNLKFFIAGDGPGKNRIENLVKELNLEGKVIFLGHVNNPAKLLSALDIVVLTSENEGVPQIIIQSLMMNKKVVATDVGSVRDLYKDNNFRLARANDVDDIVAQIEYFLLNNAEVNTREYMVNNFSKRIMSGKILEVYKKVLNE